MQGRDNETTESLLSQSVISTPSQSISENKSDQFKKATKSTKIKKIEHLKTCTDFISKLIDENNSYTDKIKSLEIKLQNLKELNKMLKNRLLLQDPSVQATAAEEERQKSNLQSELQQLINHTEEGHNIYNHLRKEIEDLQSKLEIANQGNQAFVKANQKSQDDLKAKDEKIADLETQLKTANQKSKDDLEAKDEEITELTKAVEGAEKAIENAEKSFKSMCNIALATCAFFILTTITLAVTCVYMMTQNAESVVMNSVLSNSGPELTR